jgi:microcystin-dependent protein
MSLTRLENLISSKTGRYLYVSPDDFNASDAIDNRGNSPTRPFLTIQRAFLEVSRNSFVYTATPNNEINNRFDQFTIQLAPGNHYIDNRPGDITSAFTVTSVNGDGTTATLGFTSQSFIPFTVGSQISVSGISNFNYNGTFTVTSATTSSVSYQSSATGTIVGNSAVVSSIVPFNFSNGEWNDSSIFDLNNPNNVLRKFNSIEGGVIIPRGTSLVGTDLRRTQIRPLYVPDPTNSNIERTSIFQVTGGSYFWQFTILDGDDTSNSILGGKVYSDPTTTNLVTPYYSHHKITNFIFAKKQDLGLLYQKIAQAFSLYEPEIILSGEFGPRIEENRIVGPLTDSNQIESITLNNDDTNSYTIVTVKTKIPHLFYIGQSINVNNLSIDSNFNGTFFVQSISLTDNKEFTYYINKTVAGLGFANGQIISDPNVLNVFGTIAYVQAEVDTVESASPYIFNISIRSTWGICGIWADGTRASGFKSMVIAQYTGISLQKDDRAFILYDKFTNTWNQASLNNAFSTTPYHTNSSSYWKDDWRTFHVKASEDSFIQCVSIFAVGFADHFLLESGGDMSITNSNSNFGNTSLHSKGFKGYAFNQDRGGYISDIIPPEKVNILSTEKQTYFSFDIDLTKQIADPYRLYFKSSATNPTNDPDNRPSSTVNGFKIGGKSGDAINVLLDPILSLGETSRVKESAVINPSGIQKWTADLSVLSPSNQNFNGTVYDASNLIILNEKFIQNEAFGYILQKYPYLTNRSYVNPITGESLCKRDIGYIVEAIASDLKTGGNENVINAASAYYNGTQLLYIGHSFHITGVSKTSDTVTLTFDVQSIAPFYLGQTINVSGIYSSDINSSDYNGSFVVTSVSDSSVSYTNISSETILGLLSNPTVYSNELTETLTAYEYVSNLSIAAMRNWVFLLPGCTTYFNSETVTINYVSYPQGTIVTVPSTLGIVIGMKVVGPNIPTGTYVKQILSSNQIQLGTVGSSISTGTEDTVNINLSQNNITLKFGLVASQSTIFAASRTGNVATIQTKLPHSFITGDVVNIICTTLSSYTTSSATITVLNDYEFTYITSDNGNIAYANQSGTVVESVSPQTIFTPSSANILPETNLKIIPDTNYPQYASIASSIHTYYDIIYEILNNGISAAPAINVGSKTDDSILSKNATLFTLTFVGGNTNTPHSLETGTPIKLIPRALNDNVDSKVVRLPSGFLPDTHYYVIAPGRFTQPYDFSLGEFNGSDEKVILLASSPENANAGIYIYSPETTTIDSGVVIEVYQYVKDLNYDLVKYNTSLISSTIFQTEGSHSFDLPLSSLTDDETSLPQKVFFGVGQDISGSALPTFDSNYGLGSLSNNKEYYVRYLNPTTPNVFVGSITNNILTLNSDVTGVFALGQSISGIGIVGNPIITSLFSGVQGKSGSKYTLSISQPNINYVSISSFSNSVNNSLLNNKFTIHTSLIDAKTGVNAVTFETGFNSHFYVYSNKRRSPLKYDSQLTPNAIPVKIASVSRSVGNFTGQISSTTLTITNISSGNVSVGQTISGTGIVPGTTIIGTATGTGGIGTYTVNISQTVPSNTNITTEMATIVTSTPHGLNNGDEVNVSCISDASFNTFNSQITGYISGTTLTLSTNAVGNITIGQTLFGAGIKPGTTITALISGVAGSTGTTYSVSISQTVGNDIFPININFGSKVNYVNSTTFTYYNLGNTTSTVSANGIITKVTEVVSRTGGNWYLHVQPSLIPTDLTYNGIYSRFVFLSSPASDNSYFDRIVDKRSKSDKIYRLRYVVPKNGNYRDPIVGYVVKLRRDGTRNLLPQKILLKPINNEDPTFPQILSSSEEILGLTQTQQTEGSPYNSTNPLFESTYDPYTNPVVLTSASGISCSIQSANQIILNGKNYIELTVFDINIPSDNVYTVVQITTPSGGVGQFNQGDIITWNGNSSGSAILYACYTGAGTNLNNINYLILQNSGTITYDSNVNTVFTQGSVSAILASEPDGGRSNFKNYPYATTGTSIYTMVPGDIFNLNLFSGGTVEYYIDSVTDVEDLQNTYYIFGVDTISERIQGQQDGIYYLTCLRGDIQPYPTGSGIDGNFQNFKFSQPISRVYPLNYTNDPLWFQVDDNVINDIVPIRNTNILDSAPSVSTADNYIHGYVTVNDARLSTTKELVETLIFDSGTGNNVFVNNKITSQSGNASSGSENRKIPISGDSDYPTQNKLYIELRRPSIARSGNHTFEYLGYGPGNYSTSFPSRQQIVLTPIEEYYSQAKQENGGVVLYTGLNSQGDIFIGNLEINAITGEQTYINAAITDTSDDTDASANTIAATTFDDPVTFNNTVTFNNPPSNPPVSFNTPVVISAPSQDVFGDTFDALTIKNYYVNSGVNNDPLDNGNGDIVLSNGVVQFGVWRINPRGLQSYTIRTSDTNAFPLSPSGIKDFNNDSLSGFSGQTALQWGVVAPTTGDIVLKGGVVEKHGSFGWILTENTIDNTKTWKEFGIIGSETLRTNTDQWGNFKLGINTIARADHSYYANSFVTSQVSPQANLDVVGSVFISGTLPKTFLNQPFVSTRTFTSLDNALVVGGTAANQDGSIATLRVSKTDNNISSDPSYVSGGRVGINTTSSSVIDRNLVINGNAKITGDFYFRSSISVATTTGTFNLLSNSDFVGTLNIGSYAQSIYLGTLTNTSNLYIGGTDTLNLNSNSNTVNFLTNSGGPSTLNFATNVSGISIGGVGGNTTINNSLIVEGDITGNGNIKMNGGFSSFIFPGNRGALGSIPYSHSSKESVDVVSILSTKNNQITTAGNGPWGGLSFQNAIDTYLSDAGDPLIALTGNKYYLPLYSIPTYSEGEDIIINDTEIVRVAAGGLVRTHSTPYYIIVNRQPFGTFLPITTTHPEFSIVKKINVALNSSLLLNSVTTTSPIVATGGSANNGTATITFNTQTSTPFTVGESIAVSGATPSGYNGTFAVTGATTSSVSFAVKDVVLENVYIANTTGGFYFHGFNTGTFPLTVGQTITISGVYRGAGVIDVGRTTSNEYPNTTTSYYIISTDGYSTFTLSENLGGTAITNIVGDSSTNGLTFTVTSFNEIGNISSSGIPPVDIIQQTGFPKKSQYSTSGNGSGATFDITVNPLAFNWSGHCNSSSSDYLGFYGGLSTSGSGSGAQFQVYKNPTGISSITHNNATSVGSNTYKAINQTSTSGTGNGATFDVTTNNGNYTVTLISPGTGYALYDSITILGSSLGGGSNLIITVSQIGAYNVTLVSNGYGYVIGDTITIPGNTLQGSNPTNTITITVTGISNYTSTLSSAGVNYAIGDTILIKGSNLGGYDGGAPYHNDLTITVESLGVMNGSGINTFNIVSPSVSSILGNYTYDKLVSQNSTTGSGSGATFNVTAVDGSYRVVLNSSGSGYAIGDTITIKGSNLGGVDTTNDLTLNITSVGATISPAFNLNPFEGNPTPIYLFLNRTGINAEAVLVGTSSNFAPKIFSINNGSNIVFSVDSTNGNTFIGSSTSSATPTSGALVVAGGIGAGGDINAGGDSTTNRSFIGDGIVPIGGIIMWSGSIADIPEYWHLCDGTYIDRSLYHQLFEVIGDTWGSGSGSNFKLPDLRNKFIVGAGDGYSVQNTGGSINTDVSLTSTGSLTLSTNQLPSHTHSLYPYRRVSLGNGFQGDGAELTTVVGGSNTYPDTQPTGSGDIINLSVSGYTTISTLPPYYALAYIIRIGYPSYAYVPPAFGGAFGGGGGGAS